MLGASFFYSQGLWGSGAHDVYVAESGGLLSDKTTGMFHTTGADTWTMASATTTPLALYSIWGSSANDIYAVGHGGTIAHATNGTWAIENSGTQYDLAAVW